MGQRQNGMMRSSSAVDIANRPGGSISTSTLPRRRSSSTMLAAKLSNGSTNSLRKQPYVYFGYPRERFLFRLCLQSDRTSYLSGKFL